MGQDTLWMIWSVFAHKVYREMNFPGGLDGVKKKIKNLPAMQEMWVWSLGREDSLEKGMARYCSSLIWSIPWTEELGGLQSVGLERVWFNWVSNSHVERWVPASSWSFLVSMFIISVPKCTTKPVHVCSGILLSRSKEHIWVSANDVDAPRGCSYRARPVREGKANTVY